MTCLLVTIRPVDEKTVPEPVPMDSPFRRAVMRTTVWAIRSMSSAVSRGCAVVACAAASTTVTVMVTTICLQMWFLLLLVSCVMGPVLSSQSDVSDDQRGALRRTSSPRSDS